MPIYHWETGKMADAMNYKPGDLPDFKYESESLMPRVIGCTEVCFVRAEFYLYVESCRYGNSFCYYRGNFQNIVKMSM